MDDNIRETVLKLAQPLLETAGLQLWGLEIIPGPTIRVCLYIDVPDGAGGEYSASIDQCENISRQLGLALEVEDCFSNHWVLEVSSPGLDRIFFNLAQMRPYTGDMVEVKLHEALPGTGRKYWRGKLLAVGVESFEVALASVGEDGTVIPEDAPVAIIPWKDVARARRLPIFALPRKPGKKTGGKGKNHNSQLACFCNGPRKSDMR